MSIPSSLVVVCVVLLMGLGVFVIIYALIRLVRVKSAGAESNFLIPFLGEKKIELKGPAWLLLVAMGVLMVASPILTVFAQRPSDVTVPPITVQRVQENEDLPEENNPSFQFVSDLSLLDLRQSQEEPWYAIFRHILDADKNQRIKPSVLRNIMVIRKLAPANELVLSYSTSGKLYVRCLTHAATYKEKEITQNGKSTDTWALIVDVSAMPLNTDFDVIVEATYFNAFSDSTGSDYSTYGNKQDAAENLSVVLFFPESKPMKSVDVIEYPPNGGPGTPFQGSARQHPEEGGGLTYYWTTNNTRSGYYYKLAWTW